MFKLDVELFDQYRSDSCESLENVAADFLRIQKGGAISEESLDHAFRAVHTVMRGSHLFDLKKIDELALRTEDVLSLVRSRKIVLTANLIAILLCAIDRLCGLLEDPTNSDEADIADIVAKLETSPGNYLAALQAGTMPGGRPTHGKDHDLLTLVVEDDFACRVLLQKFLSRFGECHIAINGREAVDAYRSALGEGCGYDLICMDIMMPEMDGREAMRQIRALEEQQGIISTLGAKIIMTTTVNELKEVANCFEELCDDYLVKPINLGQLKNRMEQFQLL
ncbi:MAG: response regulator [Terracidiphilus sp.]